MFGWESRLTRRSKGDRRRPGLTAAVENLEGRQLLAYNSLGFALPDLVVEGFAAPVATWGGPLAITADVKNIGSTTTIEPIALAPGATSTSDVAAFQLNVYAIPTVGQPTRGLHGHAARSANLNLASSAVLVGAINVPAIDQNTLDQVTQTITLPARPDGFPETGDIGIFLVVSPKTPILESDTTNNVSQVIPVAMNGPLPALQAVGLDLPPVMQPGDTIAPTVRVANFGTVNTSTQGSFVVQLVASTSPDFNEGISVIATSDPITSLNPLSVVPSKGGQLGTENLQPAANGNVLTFTMGPATLPLTPATYYIGLVVDPNNAIMELPSVMTPGFHSGHHGHHGSGRLITVGDAPTLELPRSVGPPIDGLPPAGVNSAGGSSNVPVFPFPFGGNPIGGLPNGQGFPAPYPPQSYASLAQSQAASNNPILLSSSQANRRITQNVPRVSQARRTSPAGGSLAARLAAGRASLNFSRSRGFRT